MKLATLRAGGRDGTLVVVSRDLRRAVRASPIAPTLQTALDNWAEASPRLQAVYAKLEADDCPDSFPLDVQSLAAPLPRAYSWTDASVYLNHMELARKLRGAEMPEGFRQRPIFYDGASAFRAPTDPILVASEDWGVDLEGELAVILTDTPMGVRADDATASIALITLVNDVSLRSIIRRDMDQGFGIYDGKPPCSMAPIAATLDELGDAWDGRKLNLPITCHIRGEWLGAPNAGEDMFFDFPTLIAAAAKTRPLAAGTVLGTGTISNFDRTKGFACVVERQMVEILESGKAKTPLLGYGDRLRIEMFAPDGGSVFGAIDQSVERA